MQPNDLVKVQTLLGFFSITPDQIEVQTEEDLIKITINLDEVEAGRLIGRFASTLDSLQLILSLMLNHGDFRHHVLLDVAGYRGRRLETIQLMVDRAKAEVVASGTPYAFPPLSATERREVHLMFKDDAEFTSFSDGYGQDRRLFLAPKDN
jgi:spoIIIJ-associated protein